MRQIQEYNYTIHDAVNLKIVQQIMLFLVKTIRSLQYTIISMSMYVMYWFIVYKFAVQLYRLGEACVARSSSHTWCFSCSLLPLKGTTI